MKFVLSGMVVFFLLSPGAALRLYAKEPIPVDLESGLRFALENNKKVKQAGENVDKAYAQIEEQRASAWPELDASADYTRLGNINEYTIDGRSFSFVPENNYSLDLTLKQKIYAPEVFEAIRASKTFAKSAEMEFQVIKADVTTEVIKAYYGYLFARDMIGVNEESVEQLTRHVDDIKARLDVGLATDFDLLRAQVQLANSIPDLTRSKNNLVIAGESLKKVLGLNPEAEIAVTGALEYHPFEISADKAVALAMENRPELRYIDYYIKTLDHNVEVARKEFQPKINLHGGLSYANDEISLRGEEEWAYRWNVGLTLEYKIFDGWKRSSKIRQYRIDASNARIEKEDLIRMISLEVKTAVSRLSEARALIQSQEKNIENALRAFEIARAGNKVGVVTELELLDAQLSVTEARSNYKRAVYDWLTANADVERAIGHASERKKEAKK